ncbi:MAG: carbon-nitrogen hydrolase [Paludibacteraceae bacterium]|nr:carbon-nitrogen hydrolase [Paludibacteraceae bacterium]
MKIALIQQRATSSPSDNQERLRSKIKQAAEQGARLVVLQELHDTLYFCQTEDTHNFSFAQPIPNGDACHFYAQVARQNNIVLVTSLFERVMAGLYHNTSVVFESDGTIAGTYRKMHIPDDPGFYEKFYFTPGDLGFHPIKTSVGTLGVMVCWDQWYPEAARLMSLAGADLLIYPTAIGSDPRDDRDEQERQRQAWITVQRGHAVANGIPVIAVNRVGHEEDPSHSSEGINFWGSSFICGPQGEILAQAACDSEELLIFDLDLNHAENVRRIWPFFRDRRIDFYEDIRKRSIQ